MSEIERRKKIWVSVGKWMESSVADDELPNFPDFSYSSSEKKLIHAVLEVTNKKREELIRLEWRVIPQDEAGYTWSDLVTISDVEKEIINKLGTDMSVWVDRILPMLLRLKPRSAALINRLGVHQALLGSIHVAMSSLEAYLVEDKNKRVKDGRKGVEKRHKESDKSKDFEQIEAVWYEWRILPESGLDYKNDGDFAENIALAFPGVSSRSIKDKCTVWAKKHGYKARRGRPKN